MIGKKDICPYPLCKEKVSLRGNNRFSLLFPLLAQRLPFLLYPFPSSLTLTEFRNGEATMAAPSRALDEFVGYFEIPDRCADLRDVVRDPVRVRSCSCLCPKSVSFLFLRDRIRVLVHGRCLCPCPCHIFKSLSAEAVHSFLSNLQAIVWNPIILLGAQFLLSFFDNDWMTH